MPAPAEASTAAALHELGCSAGPLTVGGVAATDLAARFGTPLYVFDASVLDRRMATVRRTLGPRVGTLYSVKANPSLAVVARLRSARAGAEIASLGELHVALRAGHAAADLRFAGPGKTDAEIDAALALGLGCFHAESADEVAAIAAAARARGRVAGVAVRVNLPHELGGSRLRMGGRSSRFGVDVEQVPALLRTIATDPALRLRGLHVYGGTQCTEATSFLRQATALATHAAAWERELGVPLDELDLGGGFAVPTYVGDPAFDLAAAGAGIAELLARHDRAGRQWFVELGRWLTAPAGAYLTRVVRTKASGGERHAVLDGGLHHCAAAAGLGTVLRRAPLLVAAADPHAAGGEPVTLGGPLCTPADQFAEQVELPPLRAGDLVAVLHAGAYGLSFSPTGFLSHPAPAEVMVDRGQARLVRARGEPEDALRGQLP